MRDSLPKQKKLISISEAAKFLSVSIDTVRRWDKSGVLHSERPDGKNRYFSLDELEKHKLNQPLSISEAAKKLSISATTLRRLETRGLIKPNRNNAGERIFDKDSVESFLNSDYSLRKKQIKEEILEDHTIENETQHPERKQPPENIKNYPPIIPAESSEEMPLYQNLKPLQRKPEFLATAIVFLFLVTFGIRNITVSTAKSTDISSTPSVLSETVEVEEKNASPSSTILSQTNEISTTSVNVADVIKPKRMLAVKIDDESGAVNIRQEPTTNSKKIGKAKDGDTFEFISMDSGWYEIKLATGSTGFISAKYIKEGGTNN